MITNEAWRELVAALAAHEAFPDAHVYERRSIVLTYEEVERAPDVEVTWDPELELIRIEVRP